MSLDVFEYPKLVEAEKELFGYRSPFPIGQLEYGGSESQRFGNGYEYDGARDYQLEDDARHIDWQLTAQRSDNWFTVRKYFKTRAPLTVVVSDIPTEERFAGTPGDPEAELQLSARSLGFIVGKQVVETATKDGAPVLAVWSDGVQTQRDLQAFSGPVGVRKIVQDGLDVALASRDRAAAWHNAGRRERKRLSQEPQDEIKFSEAIELGVNRSLQVSGMARFVLISDFRSDIDATLEAMKRLNHSTEVLAIQISNPLLREIPKGVDRISDGKGGSFVIETEAQRAKYREIQADKQAKLDEALKRASISGIKVDTSSPARATSL